MRDTQYLKSIRPKDFPYNLSEDEQVEWMRIADSKSLDIARRSCTDLHPPNVHARLIAEIDRRAVEDSADRRHGEEMTAAAVANHLARKAICRAHIGIALAFLAIVVAIGLAIWQHCQR